MEVLSLGSQDCDSFHRLRQGLAAGERAKTSGGRPLLESDAPRASRAPPGRPAGTGGEARVRSCRAVPAWLALRKLAGTWGPAARKSQGRASFLLV